MSDSRAALFQAVLDCPGEDAPRFAYAAYCDAHGDPYGAFIRAQLARTEALRHGSEEDASRAWRESQNLRAQHQDGAAWKNGIEKLVTQVWFLRGFVDKVRVGARQYLELADEMFRLAPIRQLVLNDVGELAIPLARDPRLARMCALIFDGKPPIGDAGLEALATSPYLRDLRALEVLQQNIGVAGLEALCASKKLPSLVYVNVNGNRFENPVEGCGTDWRTGRPDLNGAYLPPLGKQLEAKYGKLAWLYAPSLLRDFPPSDAEF